MLNRKYFFLTLLTGLFLISELFVKKVDAGKKNKKIISQVSVSEPSNLEGTPSETSSPVGSSPKLSTVTCSTTVNKLLLKNVNARKSKNFNSEDASSQRRDLEEMPAETLSSVETLSTQSERSKSSNDLHPADEALADLAMLAMNGVQNLPKEINDVEHIKNGIYKLTLKNLSSQAIESLSHLWKGSIVMSTSESDMTSSLPKKSGVPTTKRNKKAQGKQAMSSQQTDQASSSAQGRKEISSTKGKKNAFVTK